MGRRRFLALGRRVAPFGAAAALLANGCSLLPAVVGAPSLQAATLASPDAWSFTEVTLRPSVQQALYARDVFNFYADQTGPGGSLNQLPTPSGHTVDFEKDVLPHLDGEVAYALSGPIEQPQGVLLVHTNDVESIMRLGAEPDAKFSKDARGATRYTSSSGDLLAAGYQNWVVSSNDDATLTQTLDRIDGKGGNTLATRPRFKAAVDRLKGDYLGYGYLDITPVLQSQTVQDLGTGSPIATQGVLAYSLAFAAGPQGGMRAVDLRSEFISEGPLPPTFGDQGDALSAMDRLPVNNAIAFSGASFGLISSALDALPPDIVTDDQANLANAFVGPYAIGISPESGAGLDSPSFQASLSFLGQLAPDTDAATVQDLITTIFGEDTLTQHEVVTDGDWTAINVVPASIDLSQMQQQVLASDRMYQAVRPALAQDGSNAYVNVGALLSWGKDRGATSEELAALGQLRAIGTSWRSEPKGDAHGRALVIIGS